MGRNDIKTLINVKKISITTEENTPRTFEWETLTKLTAKASISKGNEVECRKLNTMYGKEKSEDIVTGYDIETESQTLEPEVMALIDGGKLRYDEIDVDKVVGYDSPKSGSTVKRISFTLTAYAEDKDTDSSTMGYTKITLRNCKGRPMDWELEDSKFTVPKLSMTSAPKQGESPMSVDFVDSLEDETLEYKMEVEDSE